MSQATMKKTSTNEILPFQVDMSKTRVAKFERAEELQKILKYMYETGEAVFIKQPQKKDELQQVKDAVATLRKNFSHILAVGTGGSSLGAQAVTSLAKKDKLGITFLDNVDPFTTSQLLETLPLEKTAIAFVSKSGTTIETMSHMLMLVEALQKKIKPEQFKTQCVAVTTPGASPLRKLAEELGIPVLIHEANLGGRFSVLSPVGMIPAAFMGLDADAFWAGSDAVVQYGLNDLNSPLFSGAEYQFRQHEEGRKSHVLMTYNDRLSVFGAWFRQLVAESLGKDGKGITPIPASGTVDQHSVLQLFMDGPDEKHFTFILGDYDGKGVAFSEKLAKQAGFDLLVGKKMGDVMAAFQEGTVGTLAERNKPIRIIRIAELNEYTLGALFMHFMLETVLTARLLKINPHDQPAVEGSKVLAKAYLSK